MNLYYEKHKETKQPFNVNANAFIPSAPAKQDETNNSEVQLGPKVKLKSVMEHAKP